MEWNEMSGKTELVFFHCKQIHVMAASVVLCYLALHLHIGICISRFIFIALIHGLCGIGFFSCTRDLFYGNGNGLYWFISFFGVRRKKEV
jgi:hypothetical protein